MTNKPVADIIAVLKNEENGGLFSGEKSKTEAQKKRWQTNKQR